MGDNTRRSNAGEPEISSEAVKRIIAECVNYRFHPYSPYRSFCADGERLLIGPGGRILGSMTFPDGSIHPDANALWITGKAAFDSLKVSSAVDFFERYKGYLEWVKNWRFLLSALADSYDVTFASDTETFKAESSDIKNIPNSAIILLSQESVDMLDGFEVTPRLRAELLCFGCLEEIANAIIGYELDGRGAIYCAIRASTLLADAQSLDPEAKRVKDLRQRSAMHAALARHAKDPRQQEKRFIRECFDDWNANAARYSTDAAFARDMLSKVEHLRSAAKIEGWVRGWRRASSEGTLEGPPSP